jgi:hypothetical protein
MPAISKHGITLLLIGIDSEGKVAEGLGGITRLQKYLFLIEREGNLNLKGDEYDFQPYKAGPYSSKLYDDLELLENLGYIRSEVTAEATEEEAAEIEKLNFEDLMGDGSDQSGDELYDGFGAHDACEERRFILTETGRKQIEEMLIKEDYKPIIDAILKIKSRFGHYSLSDLLYYVYTKYPDMTMESEIKEKVLRRRKNR